jgi:hypothetical protein
MTSNDFDQELQGRLQSLNSDLAEARMAGPTAARKRAAQRTRRQATTSVLAGVAAVAIATVIIFRPTLPGTDEAPPAVTPSETSTEEPTDTPTPTPTPTTDATIPGDALMTAEDIEDTWEAGPLWEPGEPSGDEIACIPNLSDIGVQHERATFTRDADGIGYTAQATHDIVLTTPGGAADAFTTLRERITQCAPERDDDFPRLIEQSDGSGLGDEAWLIRYFAEIPGEDLFAWKVNIALVRESDAISMTVVYWADTEVHEPPDMETPVNAAERMCEAMFGGSCVDDPEFPDIETSQYEVINGGDLSLADEPFLTDDDVNPVGDYGDGFSVSPNADLTPYDLMCLDDFAQLGAAQWGNEKWTNGLEGQVDNVVIEFSDVETAQNWITDYTSLPDRCAALGVTGPTNELTDYGVIEVDIATEAIAWSLMDTPEEAGSAFMGVGIARQGNIGVVVTFWAMSDPGDWEAYVAERLALALERAIG